MKPVGSGKPALPPASLSDPRWGWSVLPIPPGVLAGRAGASAPAPPKPPGDQDAPVCRESGPRRSTPP